MTGGMSHLNMKRVCGKNKCAGESAVLVVDRGKKNQRLNVVFTDKGVFHKFVSFDKGTDFLRLRIEGPKGLSSGPFQKFAIRESSGGDSPCSLSTGATGC